MAPLTRSSQPRTNGSTQQNGSATNWSLKKGSSPSESKLAMQRQDEEEMMVDGDEYSQDEDEYEAEGFEDEVGEDGEEEEEDGDALGPAKYEQDLYPLKTTADRVGREVEKFAEQLDRMSSLIPHTAEEKRQKAMDLVDGYHGIAKQTVDRLKRQHAARRNSAVKKDWRKRMSFLSGSFQDAAPEDDDRHEEPSGTAANPTVVDDLVYWESEKQTWDLMRRLIEVQASPGLTRAPFGLNEESPEPAIWQGFLASQRLARERQVVCQWLMDTAEQTGKDVDVIAEQLETEGKNNKGLWTHGWLHTKESIKGQKRMRSWPQAIDPEAPGVEASLMNAEKTESLITQLDPDAVTRQERVIEKQDEFFERATWIVCWEMLRRGKSWSDIQDWCRDRMENWRAISIRSGLLASYGPFIEDANQADSLLDSSAGEDEVNSKPALWRRMCFALARAGGMDEYERAVYGLLGGDLNSVETVCDTWDDYIFAHFNALLSSQYDAYLRNSFPSRYPEDVVRKTGHFDAVAFHGDPTTTSKRLIKSLRTNEAAMEEAAIPMKSLQGVLISNDFFNFALHQGALLRDYANRDQKSSLIPSAPSVESPPEEDAYHQHLNPDDYDSLRVLAHMLLVCLDLGMSKGNQMTQMFIENIIVAYMDFLRLSGKLAMVPLYASRLSPVRQNMALGRLLLDSAAGSQRRELMKLMSSLDLDVRQIIKAQLSYSYDDACKGDLSGDDTSISLLTSPDGSSTAMRVLTPNFLGGELGVDVNKLIQSFEWFLLVDGFWPETLHAGSSIYQVLLLKGDLVGARELWKRMSTSQISTTKTPSILGRRIDITDLELDLDENAVNGHKMSHGDLTMTTTVMQEQAKVYVAYEELVTALCALDEWTKVADLSRMPSQPQKAKSWRSELDRSFIRVSAAVEPLMKGWMSQPLPEDKREKIEQIRDRYIPEIVLAYISVIQFAGHVVNREHLLLSMNIATLVAAEDSDILAPFQRTGKLSELVSALAGASKAILKAGEDKGSALSKSGRAKIKRSGGGGFLRVWNVGQKI